PSVDGEERELLVEAFEIVLDRARLVLLTGTDGEIHDRSRHDDLSHICGLLHARREMYGKASDVVGAPFDLSGVGAGSQFEAEAARVFAHLDRGGNAAARTVEDREDAVTGSLDDGAAVATDDHGSVVLETVETAKPRFIAGFPSCSRRLDDVREENRHQLSLRRRALDAEFFVHEAFDVVECRVLSLAAPRIDLVVRQFDERAV